MNGAEGTILARVREFCCEQALLASGEPLRLAAAVSGGADSMALLLLLRALQPEFGYELSVCHVNHGLRGGAADRDEKFVRRVCAEWKLPLRVFRAKEMEATVGAVPPNAGEDWARRLRYACFEQLLQEGIDALATAHTENDQAETLLFRLARGTGLHGAAGIRPRRGPYLRPLLCLSRAETEACCRAAGQPWVTDETNTTDAYARNRLRRTAIPVLQSANGAAVENLARFCEKAARADAYLTQKAEELLQAAAVETAGTLPAGARYALNAGQPVWRLETLAAADALILETAMHTLVAPVRDAEEKYIRLLCGLVRQGSGAVQLTDRTRLCAAQGVLWQENAPETPAELAAEQPFDPVLRQKYPLPGGGLLTAELVLGHFPEKIQVVHKKDLKNQADYARITTLYPVITLRTRQPGDRYRPAGRGGSKPLRKWMNEVGIPPCERDHLPLLAAGSQVLWVCGAGFADGLAPGEAGGQILQLDFEKAEGQSYEHAR